MKFSKAWLDEWLSESLDTDKLTKSLTMAGLEVDAVLPVANGFEKIVIGLVEKTEQHPDADRLRVCQINIGESAPLNIVCGGANVRANLKVPVALIGAKFADGFKIKKSKLRGVVSEGMICSASELGLVESSEGIMELPDDAPLGQSVREYLQLEDQAISIDLTPNRGDCLSVMGMAREAAVLNHVELTPKTIQPIKAQNQNTLAITLSAPEGCPKYCGRVIQNINPQATTPLVMQERLRRSGLRAIHPVVDVLNYVMLELGQPMHAFDCDKLKGAIDVRFSNPQESLTLLDGKSVELKPETLVIADSQKALAMAGVMGGEESAVNTDTQNIFLESAFFNPKAIIGRARLYGLSTDASHRYERGVDPQLAVQAIEYATALLLAITGGEPGPVVSAVESQHLPATGEIAFRPARANQVLGAELSSEAMQKILQRLGLVACGREPNLTFKVPTHRFDLKIEADLIEEVARVYGYDNLPTDITEAAMSAPAKPACSRELSQVTHGLVERGYSEAITYSFVDPKLQQLLFPELKSLALVNPISSELSDMRVSLWPGLLACAQYNLHRQSQHVALFETGLRFLSSEKGLEQTSVLAGLHTGVIGDVQWNEPAREIDFYDVKGDVSALLGNLPAEFRRASHPALHPGQCAEIFLADKAIGWIGVLHPEHQNALELVHPVVLFELSWEAIATLDLPVYQPISKYPANKRDLSFLVDESIEADALIRVASRDAEEILQNVQIFDVYQGQGVPDGQKSIAMNLVIQHPGRTLVDQEINDCLESIITKLQKTFAIQLRD